MEPPNYTHEIYYVAPSSISLYIYYTLSNVNFPSSLSLVICEHATSEYCEEAGYNDIHWVVGGSSMIKPARPELEIVFLDSVFLQLEWIHYE